MSAGEIPFLRAEGGVDSKAISAVHIEVLPAGVLLFPRRAPAQPPTSRGAKRPVTGRAASSRVGPLSPLDSERENLGLATNARWPTRAFATTSRR